MNKKKVILIMTFIIVLLTLWSLVKSEESIGKMYREGIEPFKLSESNKYILRSLDPLDNTQIIKFKAPKEAINMDINVYKLDKNNQWELIHSTGTGIGEDRQPIDQLEGTLTMQLMENQSIYFNTIIGGGSVSVTTSEVILDKTQKLSAKEFMKKFSNIEVDKEIPIAIMISSSGNTIRVFDLNSYYDVSRFQGLDFVQVVTLKFTK